MEVIKLWTNLTSVDQGDCLAENPTEVVYPTAIYNRNEVDEFLRLARKDIESAMSEIEDGSSHHAHGLLAQVAFEIEDLLG